MDNPGFNDRWQEICGSIYHAFQPIVNPVTGSIIAVEALLRGYQDAGFETIDSLFDAAFQEGELFSVDLELRKSAFESFLQIESHQALKLFYNYDPRVQQMVNYRTGMTEKILDSYSQNSDIICYELSEKHQFHPEKLQALLQSTKNRGIYIALDDFGVGFSGLELFYHTEPDFLKFDRFLISDIHKNVKKRSFCSHLISLAKMQGVTVISEGIESEDEYHVCRDIGFDLMQGYYLSAPIDDPAEIGTEITAIADFNTRNRRRLQDSNAIIERNMRIPPAIPNTADMNKVIRLFHDYSEEQFFPVVDSSTMPLGLLHERKIKEYIFSPYGYNLLNNPSVCPSPAAYMERCPVVEISTAQDRLLEIFVSNPHSEGVIITRNQKYLGFLSTLSLLTILHEKNLAQARELNPLSKLPGNVLISRYIAETAQYKDRYHYYIYFDFDNFKPFNDRFGFRQGDRVIQLFADLLRQEFSSTTDFIGHIGGDDFFVGIRNSYDKLESIMAHVERVILMFQEDVSSFFDEREREEGCYSACDREQRMSSIPLLSVSGAIVIIEPGELSVGYVEEIAHELAVLKKKAKESDTHIASQRLAGIM